MILPDAIAGFVANWVFGGAVDRGIVGLHALLAASLASLSLAAALGVLMLAAAGQPAGQRTVIAALFGAVYGFGSTSFYLFLKVAPPRLFGRTNAGAIMVRGVRACLRTHSILITCHN